MTVHESAAPIRTRSASKRPSRMRSLVLCVLISAPHSRTVISPQNKRGRSGFHQARPSFAGSGRGVRGGGRVKGWPGARARGAMPAAGRSAQTVRTTRGARRGSGALRLPEDEGLQALRGDDQMFDEAVRTAQVQQRPPGTLRDAGRRIHAGLAEPLPFPACGFLGQGPQR